MLYFRDYRENNDNVSITIEAPLLWWMEINHKLDRQLDVDGLFNYIVSNRLDCNRVGMDDMLLGKGDDNIDRELFSTISKSLGNLVKAVNRLLDYEYTNNIKSMVLGLIPLGAYYVDTLSMSSDEFVSLYRENKDTRDINWTLFFKLIFSNGIFSDRYSEIVDSLDFVQVKNEEDSKWTERQYLFTVGSKLINDIKYVCLDDFTSYTVNDKNALVEWDYMRPIVEVRKSIGNNSIGNYDIAVNTLKDE